MMTPDQKQALSELFHSWKKNEITKRIFERMKAEREMMVDALINGQVEEPDVVRGRIQAITNFLEIDMENIYGE